MSKTYILQKDITSPLLSVKAGEPVRKEEGIEYYSIGCKEYYFESKYVENNPEWFLPEENKSNDSFQWTDGAVSDFWRQLLSLYVGDAKMRTNPIPQLNTFLFQYKQSKS